MGENAGVEGGQVSQGQTQQGVGTGNLAPQQTQQTQQGQQKAYAQYLQGLPESVRPMVEPVFDRWDSDVTQRFQGLQNQLSEYEPYKDLFDSYEADGLSQAAQLVEALNTPEGAEGLFRQLAQVLGYDIEGDNSPQQNQYQNPNDPYGEPQQQFSLQNDPAFQQLQQGFGQMAQLLQQQQEQQVMQQELSQVEQEFEQLVGEHFPNQELSEQQESMILTIAAQTGDLAGAFQMYKSNVGSQAQQLNTPGQNAPIIGGGAISTMPSNNIDMAKLTPEQRKEIALNALRASNANRS